MSIWELKSRDALVDVTDSTTRSFLRGWIDTIEWYVDGGIDFDRVYGEFIPTLTYFQNTKLGIDVKMTTNILYQLKNDLVTFFDGEEDYVATQEMTDCLIRAIECKH